MTRPDDVLRGVVRALKPGGRFVAEFGGGANVAQVLAAVSSCLQRRGIDAASVNPWYFPQPEEYRQLLTKHGFEVTHLNLFARPTSLPGDVVAWLETFAQSFTAVVAPDERQELLAEVREGVRPVLFNSKDGWWVDYVRLRFAAYLL